MYFNVIMCARILCCVLSSYPFRDVGSKGIAGAAVDNGGFARLEKFPFHEKKN